MKKNIRKNLANITPGGTGRSVNGRNVGGLYSEYVICWDKNSEQDLRALLAKKKKDICSFYVENPLQV